MSTMPAARHLIAIVTALCLLGLAGCARIPTSGPVGQGQEIAEEGDQKVRFLPSGPIGTETPQQLVHYFLEAGSGTQRDYEAARQYLTSDYASDWDPSKRVLVYSDDPEYVEGSDGRVTLYAEVVAEVGPDGQYSRLDTPRRMELEYVLEQVEGAWRIRQAPEGLVIRELQFSLVFKAFTLWFYNQSQRYLVPDVRWFADNATAPNRIVQAVLAGPSPWLAQGGITTAFPSGTVLQSIHNEGGRAVADFSRSISTALPDQFSRMLLQLQRSLSDVESIQEVSMTVNHALIDVEPPPEGSVLAELLVSSTPLVYQDGQIGYITGNALSPPEGIEELNDMIAGIEPTRGTLSVEQRMSAFLTPEGVVAVPFDRPESKRIDRREGLVAPALDPYGYVWTASSADHELRVTGTDKSGDREELSASGLGSEGILAIQLSREGSRAAMLVRDQGVTRLAVMSVVRDVSGKPTGFGTPIVSSLGPGQPIDLTWVDEAQTHVAVLVDDGAGSSSVRVQHIGGNLAENGPVPGGTQITGSNSTPGLRVVDGSGALFVPRAGRWEATSMQVNFLITQMA